MPRGRPRRTTVPAAGALTAAGAPAAGTRRRRGRPQVPFSFKLVLNQWLLSLLSVDKFEELAKHLRHEGLLLVAHVALGRGDGDLISENRMDGSCFGTIACQCGKSVRVDVANLIRP